MEKIKAIAVDFVLVFFGVLIFQALTLGTRLLDAGWAEWKQVVTSAILGALTVLGVALHPTMKRYGLGS
jgi:hypothetical protein